MGFSEYEKKFMSSLLVPEEKLEDERLEYFTEDEHNYLKNNDLLRRVRDYGVFPSKFFHRVNKTENICLHKLFVPSFDFFNFLEELLSEITFPFTILCDFSFLITKPLTEEIRYCFAQRSTSMETIKVIKNDHDIENLLTFFKGMTNHDYLMHSFDNHKRQSNFDKSGYNAMKLCCAVVFLSKITSLNASIPFE